MTGLSDVNELVARFRAGEQRALARAITFAESGLGAPLLGALASQTGRAIKLGLTGPPGVGKSTLCAALVALLRKARKSVGVISVDPSSPFSHGALLGDRIRLAEHFTDAGVFIRSMASRGHLGGVAGATGDAIALMDAFGKDVVIVETVGVGQSEVEIAELADTTLVVLQPGSGDAVQVLKAGILEVADVFVINKADHAMAKHLEREIHAMMQMMDYPGWVPRIVTTQAIDGTGVEQLWNAVEEHGAYLRSTAQISLRRRRAFAHRVRQLVIGTLERDVDALLAENDGATAAGTDPYARAQELLFALAPARRAT